MASEFLTEVGRLLIEFQIWQLEQQKKEAGIDAPIAKQDIDSGRKRTELSAQHTHNHSTDSAAEKVE